MGSYFSKKPKPVEMPFEVLERKIESLNPSSYPSFEKSLDWSKTKHVYSDSICIKEKYVSYGLMGTLFLFMVGFLFLSFRGKKTTNIIIEGPGDEQGYGDEGLQDEIQIGEDVNQHFKNK